jgi:DNA-directed RNA polymerase III subunit RPC7
LNLQPHPNLKKPKPLTGKEKRQIKAQKKIQEDIRRGPLYTEPTKRDVDAPAKTFSQDQFNSQYGSKGKADIDPFYGVETYSMKYAPKKRTIPQLSARPFNKELFPKELWDVLDGDAGEEVKKHINRIAEKKSLMLSDSKSKGTEEKTRIILEKIKNATGGEDDADMEEDEEPAEEEEQDYDFEDDEDQMGGDYDGEKYFDNGEGDSGDEDNTAGNDDY